MTITSKKPLPGWPRMMRLSLAAAYVDLTEPAFLREVFEARLPLPIRLDGKERWSQVAIDRALDLLTGDATQPDDWRKRVPLYADDPRYHPELR